MCVLPCAQPAIQRMGPCLHHPPRLASPQGSVMPQTALLGGTQSPHTLAMTKSKQVSGRSYAGHAKHGQPACSCQGRIPRAGSMPEMRAAPELKPSPVHPCRGSLCVRGTHGCRVPQVVPVQAQDPGPCWPGARVLAEGGRRGPHGAVSSRWRRPLEPLSRARSHKVYGPHHLAVMEIVKSVSV